MIRITLDDTKRRGGDSGQTRRARGL